MAHKPTTVRRLAGVLDQDHESAESAVKALLDELETIRQAETPLVLLEQRYGSWRAVGPFNTVNQATKACAEEGLLSGLVMPARLVHPQSIRDKRVVEIEEASPACPECGHAKFGHIDRSWKPKLANGRSGKAQPAGCMGETCSCTKTF